MNGQQTRRPSVLELVMYYLILSSQASSSLIHILDFIATINA